MGAGEWREGHVDLVILEIRERLFLKRQARVFGADRHVEKLDLLVRRGRVLKEIRHASFEIEFTFRAAAAKDAGTQLCDPCKPVKMLESKMGAALLDFGILWV